jgi:uncharacterized protein YukE
MGHEVIKLSYPDMEVIHSRALAARGTNDDALAKITSALAANVHVGASGQTQDALVQQLFRPYFNELNDIVAQFNNSVASGMEQFNETDVRNARRLGGV